MLVYGTFEAAPEGMGDVSCVAKMGSGRQADAPGALGAI